MKKLMEKEEAWKRDDEMFICGIGQSLFHVSKHVHHSMSATQNKMELWIVCRTEIHSKFPRMTHHQIEIHVTVD